MTDIEQEVAAFREQLEELAIIDHAVIGHQIDNLVHAIRTAETSKDASRAVREFCLEHRDHMDLVEAVVIGAVKNFTIDLVLRTPTYEIHSEAEKLTRLAFTMRALEIGKLMKGDK